MRWVLTLIFAACQLGCEPRDIDSQTVELEAIGEVRVMTWNILRDQWAKEGHPSWNERGPSAVGILREHRPDVVGLQEETADQVAFITSALPGYCYVKPHHSNGGGLLIRTDAWQVIESGKIPIPRERQASWAMLESTRNSERWLFYNAHFMHRKAINSAVDQMEAAKQIAAHVARYAPQSVPVVLMGDFNSLHDQPALRYLAGAAGSPVCFLNAFNLMHGPDDPRGTFRGLSREHHFDRIDHILINGHVTVDHAEIIYYDELQGPYPSDHYPVQATLKMNLQNGAEENPNKAVDSTR